MRDFFVMMASAALLVALHGGAARGALVAGRIDTFEDGTLQSWSNGVNNPNPAANISSGGPDGADDNYMRVLSNGSGPGGRLVVFNSNQWAGDYLEENVGSISMHVSNPGATDLVLRLILVDAADLQNLTTIAPVNLPAGSDWQRVSFSLAPSNLSGGTYATVMGNVTELNLLHSPNVIGARTSAPDIVATLGVDNITAIEVPEPGAMALAALALAGAAVRRGRRGESASRDGRRGRGA